MAHVVYSLSIYIYIYVYLAMHGSCLAHMLSHTILATHTMVTHGSCHARFLPARISPRADLAAHESCHARVWPRTTLATYDSCQAGFLPRLVFASYDLPMYQTDGNVHARRFRMPAGFRDKARVSATKPVCVRLIGLTVHACVAVLVHSKLLHVHLERGKQNAQTANLQMRTHSNYA